MLLMYALRDDEGDHVSLKDLKESFLKFAIVLQDMQNYDINKKKATPKQEPTAPAGPTLLSAYTVVPPKVKFGLCFKILNRNMKRDDSTWISIQLQLLPMCHTDSAVVVML